MILALAKAAPGPEAGGVPSFAGQLAHDAVAL